MSEEYTHDYTWEDQMRTEIQGFYSPCSVRFNKNSITVTMKTPFTSSGKWTLEDSVRNFLTQFDDETNYRIEVISPYRFKLHDQYKYSTAEEVLDVEVDELDGNTDYDQRVSSLLSKKLEGNAPINTLEDLNELLEDVQVQSLDEKYIAIQEEMIESELELFLNVNFENVKELLAKQLAFEIPIHKTNLETALKFGFLVGKFSQASMKDMSAIMNVYEKEFPTLYKTEG
jgi:hypothetical protein